MSIAYIVLVSGSQYKIRDLFRYVFHKNATFIFHVDSKSDLSSILLVHRLSEVFGNVHVVAAKSCSWAGYSLVDATIRSIKAAIDVSLSWEHCVLLSESHVPLLSPGKLLTALEPSTCYSEAFNVLSHPNETLKAEVLNRSAMRYRELVGVGSFGCEPRSLDMNWQERLYHGSQWLALTRSVCEYIAVEADQVGILEPFRTSVVPDENALQTLLYSRQDTHDTKVCQRTATSVSYHTPGLVFSADSFFAARDYGNLFIRKRPRELYQEIRNILEDESLLSPDAFAGIVGQDLLDLEIGPPALSKKSQALIEAFQATLSKMCIVLPLGSSTTSPKIIMRLSRDNWENELSLFILSEDAIHCKVVAVFSQQFELARFRHACLGGVLTSVLQIRVPGLYLQREVHIPVSDNGFFCLDGERGLECATDLVRHSIESIDKLSSKLGEQRGLSHSMGLLDSL